MRCEGLLRVFVRYRMEKQKKRSLCWFLSFCASSWNELSGLHRLSKKQLLQSVDKFLVLREPLGPIEQIFPELPEDRIERKDNTSDLFTRFWKTAISQSEWEVIIWHRI